MEIENNITINETELKEIITKYVGEETGFNVSKLVFRTGVRGDYDRGDAVEYVEKVICICKPKS